MAPERMHDDEVYAEPALVRRLVDRQFPEWGILPLHPVVSAGTSNALYRLGEDLVVRLPRVASAVPHLATENRWLPRMAPHLPVAIPTPVAMGAPERGYPWPWAIYRWLDGANPSADQFVGSDGAPSARQVATGLAGFVTALHRIDTTGAPRSGRGGPLVARDVQTRQAINELRNDPATAVEFDYDAVTAAWDSALTEPPWNRPPVWIHGDLSPMNVLCVPVGQRTDRLAAVIDFGSMGIGDPACDLIAAWNLLPASTRDEFHDAIAADGATRQRGRGWALSIALIQLPYYRVTNPVMATNARWVIREVLADHSANKLFGQ